MDGEVGRGLRLEGSLGAGWELFGDSEGSGKGWLALWWWWSLLWLLWLTWWETGGGGGFGVGGRRVGVRVLEEGCYCPRWFCVEYSSSVMLGVSGDVFPENLWEMVGFSSYSNSNFQKRFGVLGS